MPLSDRFKVNIYLSEGAGDNVFVCSSHGLFDNKLCNVNTTEFSPRCLHFLWEKEQRKKVSLSTQISTSSQEFLLGVGSALVQR